MGADELCRHVYGTTQRIEDGKHELAPSIEQVDGDVHFVDDAIMCARMQLDRPEDN